MAAENNSRTVADADTIGESVSFPHVTAVATGWMLDFMFLSLCRRFKEGKRDEFSETLSAFRAIHQSSNIKGNEKAKICAFLARVMNGKLLDVQFEDDDPVMPLVSAAKIWSDLQHTVSDKSLFKNVAILLFVQSVAVCLEKDQRSSASSVLRWFENNLELPQGLKVKLSKIVARRETYHPFLMSFSFSRLLETVQSYLDAYVEKNPSDYLLKAATKMVQSSQQTEGLENVVSPDSSLSEKADDVTEDRRKRKSVVCRRPKRKLLSIQNSDVWKPDTCKKLCASRRRISSNELSQMTSENPLGTLEVQKIRKPPQKWTPQLDKYLRDGVKHHGQGKWSRILMDYDFEGRTGTMLKDRWRVLLRAYKVG